MLADFNSFYTAMTVTKVNVTWRGGTAMGVSGVVRA